MSFLFQDSWNDELIDTIFEIVEQGSLAAEVSSVSGLKTLVTPFQFHFLCMSAETIVQIVVPGRQIFSCLLESPEIDIFVVGVIGRRPAPYKFTGHRRV